MVNRVPALLRRRAVNLRAEARRLGGGVGDAASARPGIRFTIAKSSAFVPRSWFKSTALLRGWTASPMARRTAATSAFHSVWCIQ